MSYNNTTMDYRIDIAAPYSEYMQNEARIETIKVRFSFFPLDYDQINVSDLVSEEQFINFSSRSSGVRYRIGLSFIDATVDGYLSVGDHFMLRFWNATGDRCRFPDPIDLDGRTYDGDGSYSVIAGIHGPHPPLPAHDDPNGDLVPTQGHRS